jgi:hypothetical protein
MEVRVLSATERRELTPEATGLVYRFLYLESLPLEVVEKGLLEAHLLFQASQTPVDAGTLLDLFDDAFDALPPAGLRVADRSGDTVRYV